jgi:predicted DNA-binding ArsR family transcriptional regulator
MVEINGIEIEEESDNGIMSVVKITRQSSNGTKGGKAMRVPTEKVKDYISEVKNAIENGGDGIIEIPEALAPISQGAISPISVV